METFSWYIALSVFVTGVFIFICIREYYRYSSYQDAVHTFLDNEDCPAYMDHIAREYYERDESPERAAEAIRLEWERY